MNVPKNLKYTRDHEWILVEDDIVTIGITDHAQGELGDIIFIELPEEGDTFEKGESIGTIEAVKTVADLFTPVSGEIIEINEDLEDASEKINNDAFGEGWIVKIKLSVLSELDELLTAEEYEKVIG